MQKEPTRTVEDCASIFTYIAAAAAALSTAAAADTPNPAPEIPEVLSLGLPQARTEASDAYEWGTYDASKILNFVYDYDEDGDGGLSRTELNNALRDQGIDIQISEAAFTHFDTGYNGGDWYRNYETPRFLESRDLHDGSLDVDELGHMQDEYVGDELVIRTNKVTGEHILDIADEYKTQAFQDFMDLEVQAAEQRAVRAFGAEVMDKAMQESVARFKSEQRLKRLRQAAAGTATVLTAAALAAKLNAMRVEGDNRRRAKDRDREEQAIEEGLQNALRMSKQRGDKDWTKVNGEIVPSAEVECPLCYEPLGGAEGWIIRRCGHAFCTDCAATWAQQNSKCPICMQQGTRFQTEDGRNIYRVKLRF